jgi:hypothetical protein
MSALPARNEKRELDQFLQIKMKRLSSNSVEPENRGESLIFEMAGSETKVNGS